ncbi:hypothetical protein FHX69_0186 [Prauserella muralis]|nr:hypothetical protein FHX69_0186 [Prauserella muralis]
MPFYAVGARRMDDRPDPGGWQLDDPSGGERRVHR